MGHKLPIGIQSFEDLRSKGFFYADKTALAYKLASEGKYYFLSRPRRFGKSLLLNTFESYFQGRKDLFKGLAIGKLEQEWTEYPVLHLDLNTRNYQEPESLIAELNKHLELWEAKYGNEFNDRSIEERFSQIIRLAHEKTGRQVVILVDEYDKPLLQTIEKPELQEDYRATLKGFYGALKSMDGSIRFAFLTGVTKFGKVSIFSDLNNLNDISMTAAYYDICGITDKELHDNLDLDVHELASNLKRSAEETYALLKENYDGYHFCPEDRPGIYNPFSLLNAFFKGRLDSYWFETGTPTYLVELLKQHDYNLPTLSETTADADVLNSIDAMGDNPVPVIYQSGYLTIKDYDEEFGVFRLGFPNKEVENGFLKFLVPYYTNLRKGNTSSYIQRLVLDVRSGNIEGFITCLRSFFADTPYELIKNLENHYQNVLFILFKLIGFYVKAEYHTSAGRIDMTLETTDSIYVMEFKMDRSAREAIDQINAKSYTLPFEVSGKKTIKMGFNFDSATRNIEDWIVE